MLQVASTAMTSRVCRSKPLGHWPSGTPDVLSLSRSVKPAPHSHQGLTFECVSQIRVYIPATRQDLPTIDICERKRTMHIRFFGSVLFGCPRFCFQRLGDLGICHYYSCLVRVILFNGSYVVSCAVFHSIAMLEGGQVPRLVWAGKTGSVHPSNHIFGMIHMERFLRMKARF